MKNNDISAAYGQPLQPGKIADAALFARFSESGFLAGALENIASDRPLVLISDDEDTLSDIDGLRRYRLSEIEMDEAAFDPQTVLEAFGRLLEECGTKTVAIVDMSWSVEAVQGGSMFDIWSAITEQLNTVRNAAIISLYNLDLLTENQMQAVLRAHMQFVAPSGVYQNPFWLPSELVEGATLDRQMAFLLGRAVPDYTGLEFFDEDGRGMARSSGPDWLSTRRRIDVARHLEPRWHIRCLGQLRVYRDGELVNWNLPGSAPKKSRTLFAYLMNAGEKGAHAERICELLWPGDAPEDTKKARLHHAVAMLRKTLNTKDSVLRSGEYYQLNPPVGSWTDISSFEQSCRRGLSLAKQGLEVEALKVYAPGERLYEGDLFEDIPVEYVHSELEDWCLPRRRWLREMALKLYRDMAIIFRSQGQLDNALERCRMALSMDPANEDTNIEAMRIFHAQGRIDAITRQYRQYLTTAEEEGSVPQNAPIHRLYKNLMS